MKPQAYYNEFDAHAAQWLRNLMKAGHIAPGYVDERDIQDVTPYDLKEFTQVHLFAGIGTWSYALRRTGWSDDRRVWTASCPCQPFSAAGQGDGFADERHLWPSVHWLIQQCRPADLYGEQVASKAVDPWIDLVQADVEALGYAFGCVAFPAAGVGAPHLRDRTYWYASSPSHRGVGHSDRSGLEGFRSGHREPFGHGQGALRSVAQASELGRLAYTEQPAGERSEPGEACSAGPHGELDGRSELVEGQPLPGPTNGHWGTVDWLHCRDGKWRPVEPGTFPLVDGAAGRVGRLRAYGNGIVAQAAEEFIRSKQ